LNPLFTCQNVIYGGDTEGGRGTYAKTPIWEGVCQDPIVIYKVINNGGRMGLVIRSYEHDMVSVLKPCGSLTIFGNIESFCINSSWGC
jgi:hypothetical protein